MVAWRELCITLSYTIEGSLCGGSGVNMPHDRIMAWDPWGPTPASPTEASHDGHFHCQHYVLTGVAVAKTVPVLDGTQTTAGTVGEVVRALTQKYRDLDSMQALSTAAGEDDSSSDGSDGG